MNNGSITADLSKLISWLQARGHKVAVFATDPIPIQERLHQYGLPAVDLYLDSGVVGSKKGSKAWITEAVRRLGIPRHGMLYVGDDQQDWREAINTGTFPLHARWAKAEHEKNLLAVNDPRDLFKFLSHFFLSPTRWEFSLDVPFAGVTLRSLLHPDTELQESEHRTFTPKDVFKYNRKAVVGGWDARHLLTLHGISNLYCEGLIPACCWFGVYPSHTAGQISQDLAAFLKPAASFFHGFFKPDLLVRSVDAVDTSRARHSRQAVSFTDQANTVHVNPDYQGKINGRTVIVFDDFTTTGMSMDWARLLLQSAGTGRVIQMTVGKFPKPYRVYSPRHPGLIVPFQMTRYDESDFNYVEHAVPDDHTSQQVTIKMFQHWSRGESYPL